MMKKIVLSLILLSSFFCYSQNNETLEDKSENCSFPPLRVYLNDHDETGTNIRKDPNGEIIMKLKETDDYFFFEVTEVQDGWFQVISIQGVEYDNIDLPGDKGWIHYSVIGASTRKTVELLESPKTGKVVGQIEGEISVKIKDTCSDWVEIEYNGISGWVESEWLCGNPVTTCP